MNVFCWRQLLMLLLLLIGVDVDDLRTFSLIFVEILIGF
jgi:hypothetical protein